RDLRFGLVLEPAAVLRGRLGKRTLERDRLCRALEEVGDDLQPLRLGAKLEQLLLPLGPEVDACGELEREHARLRIRLVEVGLDARSELAETLERPLADIAFGHEVFVSERLDFGGQERAARRGREYPKPLASLDRDVEPPVVETIEDVDDRRARADLPHAVVALEHEAAIR